MLRYNLIIFVQLRDFLRVPSWFHVDALYHKGTQRGFTMEHQEVSPHLTFMVKTLVKNHCHQMLALLRPVFFLATNYYLIFASL